MTSPVVVLLIADDSTRLYIYFHHYRTTTKLWVSKWRLQFSVRSSGSQSGALIPNSRLQFPVRGSNSQFETNYQFEAPLASSTLWFPIRGSNSPSEPLVRILRVVLPVQDSSSQVLRVVWVRKVRRRGVYTEKVESALRNHQSTHMNY